MRFILFILAIVLGSLFTTASTSMHGGEAVIILPTSGEVSITQGQMVRAFLYTPERGWSSCSRGMDLDYKEVAITHMELWHGDRLIHVVEKRDGRWDTFRKDPTTLCVHVNSPYRSNWHFDYLRLYETGDYELHWTRGWFVPLSDGGDYLPVDGYPDLYQPLREDFTVIIHVEAGDWDWDYHH